MFRYPDKPSRQLHREGLDELPHGYVSQLKMDGWRCVLARTPAGWTFTSRHKKPIPISCALAGAVGDALENLPIGTVLDGEWLARRPAARDESLWLFDIMQYADKPLWRESTLWRMRLLRSLLPAGLIVPWTEDVDYGEVFDDFAGRADAEGIVLKWHAAPYIGSFRQSALNPGWLKAKWRAGEDGQTVLAAACVGGSSHAL